MSEIRVNNFKAEDGIGAPSFPNGINVTGVVTATTFSGAVSGTTGTFSGNVSIGGTLTYEDVTNIDSVGLVTAREGVFLPDDKKLLIGNTAGSPDLQIFHSAGNSFISHNSSLNLKIQASDLILADVDGTEFFHGKNNAGVDLKHNGNIKLATTSTGVTVTGTVTDSKGDLRKIPFKQESNAYTLVAADAGKAIEAQGNITVPNGVFGSGDAITIINDTASDLSILMGSGLGSMFNVATGTSGNLTFGGRGMATIYFVNGTTCYISGSRLS